MATDKKIIRGLASRYVLGTMDEEQMFAFIVGGDNARCNDRCSFLENTRIQGMLVTLHADGSYLMLKRHK